MKKTGYKILLCLLGLIATDCSLSQMAVNQTATILVKAMPAYEREMNLEFAQQAIVSSLKQIEGLLEVAPDNPELLLLASRSFATFAFGFIEEKIGIASRRYNFEEKERLVNEAVDFYSRARAYGLRLIDQYRRGFSAALDKDLDHLSEEMKHFEKKHVPALFWTAFAWGNIVNLRQDIPARLAELPKIDMIMQCVLRLDETYYFGGPHMFYGVYYGGRPEMLGGEPEKAKHHFDRAIEISRGKFLLTRFLLAKYYAVRVQDKSLFEQTLNEIISTPKGLLPKQGLANQIARRNAERWIGFADDIFF